MQPLKFAAPGRSPALEPPLTRTWTSTPKRISLADFFLSVSNPPNGFQYRNCCEEKSTRQRKRDSMPNVALLVHPSLIGCFIPPLGGDRMAREDDDNSLMRRGGTLMGGGGDSLRASPLRERRRGGCRRQFRGRFCP
ncbi:hypothetical protein TNCV_3919081 [Trichonephila clavipes]|nr:hypothetical protein TNCV_3919081 [Trichonephila clavipes]